MRWMADLLEEGNELTVCITLAQLLPPFPKVGYASFFSTNYFSFFKIYSMCYVSRYNIIIYI